MIFSFVFLLLIFSFELSYATWSLLVGGLLGFLSFLGLTVYCLSQWFCGRGERLPGDVGEVVHYDRSQSPGWIRSWLENDEI